MANPNMIDDKIWAKVVPIMREHCPRLTEDDFIDADQRMDLLTAKIQNRHWINRIEAQRLVLNAVLQAKSL